MIPPSGTDDVGDDVADHDGIPDRGTTPLPATAATRRRQLVAALRSGQSAMSVGLLVNGLASYVLLAAAGRALGPAEFAPVSVLWATLFLVGGGLFQPFEQELGRSIAARRTRAIGIGALVRRTTSAAGALYVLVATATLAASAPIADSLFRGDRGFVVALVVGIASVGCLLVVRGLLAGSGRYFGYAVLFLADAMAKAVPAVILALFVAHRPILFGAVIALSGFVGAAVPLTRGTRLGPPGPRPAWSALGSSLSFLLLTSILSAVTLNVGTIAVELLATDRQQDRAGVFLSGLVISRVPLFLFQAVQAIILPRLARQAAAGEMGGFRQDLRRLSAALLALTTGATVASALIGPFAVRLLFGADFAILTARDMAMLTGASMLMVCALTINQAQLALQHQRQTGWPWGVASIVFVVVTAVAGSDLFVRVESGMVAAAATVTAIAAWLLSREMRHPDEHRDPTVVL